MQHFFQHISSPKEITYDIETMIDDTKNISTATNLRDRELPRNILFL
ncbi:hypothetical protein [Membranihabitans marinus]|nr:hypothetical protein [Membranihabitans marinus]